MRFDRTESGQPLTHLLIPFTLTAFIIIVDQALKSYIAANWPLPNPDARVFIKDVFGNGAFQIWHLRNRAIAFSLGSNIPDSLRTALFIILPIGVLGFLVWYYFNTRELTNLQRWAIAGIIGGGAGNIIDRIFRPEGVVDFISVSLKFLRLKIFDPWPTFNIADTCVVICCILFLITILINYKTLSK